MNVLTDWFISGFSDTRTSAAQIIGVLPLILSFFIFMQKSRKKIIVFKACSDLLWAIHFFVLGEYTGGVINSVNVLRNVVFAQKGKKWAYNWFIPIIFCIFTAICALPGFEGIKSTFAILGSCLAIIGFWQTEVRRLRIFNLIGVTLWLIYGIWTVSISTIIANSLSIASILITLHHEKKS